MILAYTKHLELQIRETNVDISKIDDLSLKTFEIVIASFQIIDKLNKARFFQNTFILAESSMEMVLRMFFLTFCNSVI